MIFFQELAIKIITSNFGGKILYVAVTKTRYVETK